MRYMCIDAGLDGVMRERERERLDVRYTEQHTYTYRANHILYIYIYISKQAELTRSHQLNEKQLSVAQASLAHKEELLDSKLRETHLLQRSLEVKIHEHTTHLENELNLCQRNYQQDAAEWQVST